MGMDQEVSGLEERLEPKTKSAQEQGGGGMGAPSAPNLGLDSALTRDQTKDSCGRNSKLEGMGEGVMDGKAEEQEERWGWRTGRDSPEG